MPETSNQKLSPAEVKLEQIGKLVEDAKDEFKSLNIGGTNYSQTSVWNFLMNIEKILKRGTIQEEAKRLRFLAKSLCQSYDDGVPCAAVRMGLVKDDCDKCPVMEMRWLSDRIVNHFDKKDFYHA